MKMFALTVFAVVSTMPMASASAKDGKQIDASARKIEELQKERIATLKEQVDIVTKLNPIEYIPLEDSCKARLLLLQAQAEVVENAADRLALCEDALKSFWQYYQTVKTKFDVGLATVPDLAYVRARLEEVRKLLERAKAKEANPKDGNLDHLCLAWVLGWGEIVDLEKNVAQADAEFKNGTGSYERALEAHQLLLRAKLEAAEKDDDRIARCQQALESVKKSEELAKAQAESTPAGRATVLKFKARRLEFEIKLEQAKLRQAKEDE